MVNLIQQLDLKQLIKGSKLTQKQIAKKLFISEKWLSTLVNKHINDLTIAQLDKILTCIGYKLEINITD